MDCNPEGHSLAVSAIQLRKHAGGVASTKLANQGNNIKYFMVNSCLCLSVNLTQMAKLAHKRQRRIQVEDK